MDWQVYNPSGVLIAQCFHAEDAAALVALYGEGAQIKNGRILVWNEGKEEFAAEESYDRVTATCHRRSTKVGR